MTADLTGVPTTDGLMLRRDLVAAGHTDRTISALVRCGALRRLGRGQYACTPPPSSPRAAAVERVRAELLCSPAAAATHASALLLHDIPLLQLPSQVHLGVAADARRHARAGVRRHALMAACPVVTVGGWRSVALPWALALSTEGSSAEAAVVTIDHALHTGKVTRAQLDEVAQRVAGTRSSTGLRRALALTDGRSESPGESRLRLVLRSLGIAVIPQHEVWHDSRLVARVDFLVEGTRVVLEFDGLTKYEGAQGRDALAREKAREDRLRSLGYEVVRIVWSDLAHPQRVQHLIESAVSRSGRRVA